ncbi:MAG TPA: hypothetical protein VGE07_14190 [Herpetosiphonaceae bacterium]
MADEVLPRTRTLAPGVKLGANALTVLSETIDYLRTVQEETTKRAQIAARRDVLVLALETERALMAQYIERHFAERKTALDALVQLLHTGVAAKDTALVDRALMGMLTILQENPLTSLAAFRQQLADPNGVIEF